MAQKSKVFEQLEKKPPKNHVHSFRVKKFLLFILSTKNSFGRIFVEFFCLKKKTFFFAFSSDISLCLFYRGSGKAVFQGGAPKYRADDLTETVSKLS